MNYKLHGSIQHSAQLIEEINGHGLGTLSEEALEANNKYLRRYMEKLSRNCSGELQLKDVSTRALELSNPTIQERIRSFQRELYCKICEGNDHSCRSCSSNKNIQSNDSYETLFNSIVIDNK